MKTIADLQHATSTANDFFSSMLDAYKNGNRSEELIVCFNKLCCAIDDATEILQNACVYCAYGDDDEKTI